MRSDMKIRATVNSTARAPSVEASEHILDLAGPCTATESSCFKENNNIYKSESPKLCVEPLQMKRKKKGGGYNLRKSLAWDKAFFTEEGVLDPVELSVINGASCNGDEDQGKYGKKDCSSPKTSSLNNMTSTSLTSHKFPTHLGNKSASRCGDCPRPLPSPSLKRQANVNVGKAAGKDFKLPKVPVCSTTMSSILKASCVSHNQITKPDFSIQRNSGSKSFPKSIQNTLSASKPSSLRSARYSDGNSGISSSKRLSSVNLSPGLDDNAKNSGLQMISDIMTPVRPVNSSEAKQESTSFAVPFSRNAHVGGMTMHPSQNQPMKPSGLRMPSPSLSFFSQPKRSVFHDLPTRDKETDVCGSQKPENSRLGDNLRAHKIDNKIPASAISSSKVISSSLECMTSSHVNAVEVIKPNMDRKPMQKIPYISNIRTRELQKIDFELPAERRSHEQVMDDKFSRKAIEGYQEEACKPDFRQPQIDPSKDSLGETGKETDKDKNVLRTKERVSEHLGVSQLNGSPFGASARIIEAFKHSQAKAENSYFGSDHLHSNLLNRSAFTELSSDIHTGEVRMENVVFSPSVGGCKNGTDMEPPRNVESNTSDRLLPEKQLCLQNSQQEKNVEKLMFVVPDKKDGSKVMDDTKTASSPPSPGKVHDCNFDEDKMTGKIVSTEFNFLDDSLSSENHSSLTDVSFDRDFMSNAIVLSSNPANKNLPTSLHQNTQKTEIDYCSSFPESRTRQGSQENTLGKVTEMGATIQDGSADNQLTSDMALKESESSTNNLRNLLDSRSVALQSTEINVLNEYCVKESELLTLPSSEFEAENVANHNNGSHCENYLNVKCQADVSYVYNVKGRTKGFVTGETGLYLSTSTSPSLSANETPLRDENCNDAYGIRGYTADIIPDLSRVEPFSETNAIEVSGDTDTSFSCLQPKSEHAKGEAESTPTNKNGDGPNDKSRLSVLPQNAIPFSDEWLAAIEAAGEDILTMKSGAVQNSPPDKSIPEPGPYSPVKRKNNQIGPFDCTKKTTNVVHSNSD